MNSLQIICNNALCTHLCSSLSSRPICSDILICTQNNGKNSNNNRKEESKQQGRQMFMTGCKDICLHFSITELKAQTQCYRTEPIIKNSGESKVKDGRPRIFLLLRDIGNDVDSKQKPSSSLSHSIFLHKK